MHSALVTAQYQYEGEALIVLIVNWTYLLFQFHKNIPGERLETHAVLLLNGNRDMASLGGIDVSNGSRLARVCTSNDGTRIAVP